MTDHSPAFDLLRRVTVLAVEPSSLDRAMAFPTEIGWATAPRYNGGSIMIQPDGWANSEARWSRQAERVYSITQDMLRQQGLLIRRAAMVVASTLAGRVVIVDSDREAELFDRLLAEAGWEHEFPRVANLRDTIRRMSGEYQAYGQCREAALNRFGLWEIDRRARLDAQVLLATWDIAVERYGQDAAFLALGEQFDDIADDRLEKRRAGRKALVEAVMRAEEARRRNAAPDGVYAPLTGCIATQEPPVEDLDDAEEMPLDEALTVLSRFAFHGDGQ